MLFVDVIEEKDCILLRVEKAKCFIYKATIESHREIKIHVYGKRQIQVENFSEENIGR